MVARKQMPQARQTDQILYHLFLKRADAQGATDERFLLANPVMGADNAPAPTGRLEYVIRGIHICVAADTNVVIRNATGTVWEMDVPGGAGSFPIPADAPIPVGKNEYPRLTIVGTEKIIVHLLTTMEPVPYVPAR